MAADLLAFTAEDAAAAAEDDAAADAIPAECCGCSGSKRGDWEG
jgi:hypothetical protein